jgi:cyclopropane fatty-acyl-phospholipid synthase-like methyltransferase
VSEAPREPWWADYFDDHFAELYEPHLPPEATRAEVEAIMELLGLEPGARVLDLACGWGRHSVELARERMRVTGVDLAAPLLARGRRLADAAGVEVAWLRADARELPFAGEFDAVLSLFSSLGYFLSDAEDLRVLAAARSALRPDGLFLLETMHRDHVVRHYAERDWWHGPTGEPVWVEREFDALAGVSREWLRWLEAGEVREKYHELRVRTATEWASLLDAAGLEPAGWYGGWEAEELDADSERLIVVARPAE